MKLILERKIIYFFVIAILFIPTDGICSTMKINPGSMVYTTNWSNWLWGENFPDDVISFSISGTFDLTINEGAFNPFAGIIDPNTIIFSNIDVIASNVSDRTWEFPTFMGQYTSPNIYGTEDACFLDTTPGTCWSNGNFGWYEGTFSDGNLVLSGRKNPSILSGANGYYYEISAQAVPIPPAELMFVCGIFLLFLNSFKRRSQFSNP